VLTALGLKGIHVKRTRIKICGLTERTNLDMVIAAGADAIGLVFYPPSPRFVCAAHAAELIARLPPFVTVTGLFVNPTEQELMEVVRQVPLQLLQFHGDETPAQCAALAASVQVCRLSKLSASGLTQGPMICYNQTRLFARKSFISRFAAGYFRRKLRW
jgi:phosphoribosylanthranilate isomerase